MNMARGPGLMIVPVIIGRVMDLCGVAAIFLVTAVSDGTGASVPQAGGLWQGCMSSPGKKSPPFLQLPAPYMLPGQ
ncbi:MAG: hypothetical protein GYA23_01140 [Methanomicrobiales archaeon]|nr:hypothetical protein [Methanomicrobiales archaeon]